MPNIPRSLYVNKMVRSKAEKTPDYTWKGVNIWCPGFNIQNSYWIMMEWE